MTELSNHSTSRLGSLLEQALDTVNKADATAALARVDALRAQQPSATRHELVDALIKEKAIQTGVIGAVTSAPAIIPELGTLTALTIGIAADVGMTLKLQSELALEIAAVYDHAWQPDEWRNGMILVAGVNVGAEQMVNKAGQRIALEAGERFAGRSLLKAIPVFGVVASAAVNVLLTTVIGRRAHAYFELGPEAVGDWGESVRALAGVDERRLVAWSGEALRAAIPQINAQLGAAVRATATQGRAAAGKLVSRLRELRRQSQLHLDDRSEVDAG